jgi:spermidine/putrescine-binding protein
MIIDDYKSHNITNKQMTHKGMIKIIKKSLLTLLIALGVIVTSACNSETNPSETKSQSPSPSHVKLTNQSSTVKDDFELKLFADKSTYTSNEPIQIWANFKYTGDKEEIRIGHAMYYLGFKIVQMDGNLKFEGGMKQPYKSTVLRKGIDYRTDYIKSVGYSDDDPNAEIYKKFIEGKEIHLPSGTYKVSTVANFDLPDMDKPNYTIPLDITIQVTQ